jgi:hypothetical protein
MINNVVGIDGSSRIGIPGFKVVAELRFFIWLLTLPDFKKRVTWFSNPGNQDLSTRAIVEYISVVKQMDSSHGNSKKDN